MALLSVQLEVKSLEEAIKDTKYSPELVLIKMDKRSITSPADENQKLCPVCDKLIKRKANYERHMKEKHDEKETGLSCKSQDCSYVCYSKWQETLNKHMFSKSCPSIKCDRCGSFAKSLARHFKGQRCNKQYICKICNQGFSQAKNMRKHINTNHNKAWWNKLIFLCV